MITKTKYDISLMKECFFEILVNSVRTTRVKCVVRPVRLDPLNAGQYTRKPSPFFDLDRRGRVPDPKNRK